MWGLGRLRTVCVGVCDVRLTVCGCVYVCVCVLRGTNGICVGV